MTRKVIDILKSYIEDGSVDPQRLSEAILELGKETDRLYCGGLPTDDTQYLYDTLLWLSGHAAAEGREA
ncbi:MAG: hypothetical protein LUI09_01715 [Prevotellaceae bacterium]|nr:hypothetical protein [Prevotellaceae bacterium]